MMTIADRHGGGQYGGAIPLQSLENSFARRSSIFAELGSRSGTVVVQSSTPVVSESLGEPGINV